MNDVGEQVMLVAWHAFAGMAGTVNNMLLVNNAARCGGAFVND